MEGLGLDKYKQSRVNLPNMTAAYLKGATQSIFNEDASGVQSVMDFLEQEPLTGAEEEYLDQLVKSASSDHWAGVTQSPTPGSLFNLLTGKEGDYYGQNLRQMGSEKRHRESIGRTGASREWWESYYQKHGVKPGPDIMSIFLGQLSPEDAGLKKIDEEYTGDYPYRGDEIWDLSPYMERYTGQPIFTKNNPQELIDVLKNLKIGETKDYGDSFEDSPWLTNSANMIHSIDMGHLTHGFGRDDKGLYYYVSDIWDTASKPNAREGHTFGDLIEVASDAYPINFYGKDYLEGNLYDIIRYDDR